MLDESSINQLELPLLLKKILLNKLQQMKGEKKSEMEPSIEVAKVVEKLDFLYSQVLGSSNFIESLQLIHKILNNVYSDPQNPVFRKINPSKPVIQSKITKYSPGIELLIMAGFNYISSSSLEIKEPDPKTMANLNLIIHKIQEYGEKICKHWINSS